MTSIFTPFSEVSFKMEDEIFHFIYPSMSVLIRFQSQVLNHTPVGKVKCKYPYFRILRKGSDDPTYFFGADSESTQMMY